MTTVVSTRRPLDAVGILLSVLCLIHCLAVPLIATGALAWMASESIHIGLTLALAGVVFAVAWPSYKRHRQAIVPVLLLTGVTLLVVAVVGEERLGEAFETGLTAVGSMILVLGHILNLRLQRMRR